MKCAFAELNLKLVFREISTKNDGDQREFLDVNHVIDKTEKGVFYVKNHIKPRAENLVFVNGMSHHPRSIYKSIVFGYPAKPLKKHIQSFLHNQQITIRTWII